MRPESPARHYGSLILLVLFALGVVAVQARWLSLDTRPPEWDQSIHLASAMDFRDILEQHPLALPKALVTKDAYYPPLIPFACSFACLGRKGWWAADLSMSFFTALLGLAVFALARRHYGSVAALAVAAVVCAVPGVANQSRTFMLDVPLAALVAVNLFLLDRCRGFGRPWTSFGLGLALGLGLLAKWTLTLYLGLPLWLELLQAREELGGFKPCLKRLAPVLGGALLVAGPWYAWNTVPVLKSALFFAYHREEGRPAIFSAGGFLFYPRLFPDMYGVWGTAICLLGAAWSLARKSVRRWLWVFLAPFLVLCLMKAKNERYLVPELPAMAMMMAPLFATKPDPSRGRTALGLAVFAFACFAMAAAVLGPLGSGMNRLLPVGGDYHIEDVLAKAETLARPGQRVGLIVVPDHSFMNNISMELYAAEYHPRVRVQGLFNFPMFASAFVVKTGSQGYEFSNYALRASITAQALDPAGALSREFREAGRWTLPTGEQDVLFARKPTRMRPARLKSLLRRDMAGLLAGYTRGVRGFTMAFVPDPGQCRLKSVDIGFERGRLGDYLHKNAGLDVSAAHLRFYGVELDPTALEQGQLKLLNLDSAEVVSFRTSAADLAAFLGEVAPQLEGFQVDVSRGAVGVRAKWKGLPLEATVGLGVVDGSNIAFQVRRLRVAGLPLPASVAQYLLKDLNPLLKTENFPIRLVLPPLSLAGGTLAFGPAR